MCVHFCQLRKQDLDPQLYLNGTQILIIGETKFLGFIFYSKLFFIPPVTRLDYCNSILYNVPKSKTDRLQTSESMCAYLDKIAT